MFACEIRDPIHRTIGVDADDLALVDHPFVQRLRHVRQLGSVSMVYPGATHDRLNHSLGAMHLANHVWTSVMERDGAMLAERYGAEAVAYVGRILRRAGLLHDTGHPPFSHVGEPFLPPLKEVAVPAAWWRHGLPNRATRHEDMSVMVIAALADGARALLSATEAQDIASLVHKEIAPSPEWSERFGQDDGGLHDVAHTFISGELDCDRMDYLLRDAYMCGTVYGNYDLERLIDGQGLTTVNGRLARYIDGNTARSFEDFLLARYHMFLQVYQHKTSVGFDVCLREAMAAGEVSLHLPGDAAGYAECRDGSVIEALFAAARRPEAEWSRRFVRRNPLKLLMSAEAARPGDQRLLERLRGLLVEAGVRGYEANSHQYLSKLPTDIGDVGLYVRRKVVGRLVLEPIARYSGLLTKYNEEISLTHLYVRREDWPTLNPRLAKIDVSMD